MLTLKYKIMLMLLKFLKAYKPQNKRKPKMICIHIYEYL